MPDDKRPHFIRRTLIAGLLILLPLFITYVLIAFLVNIFTGVGAPLVTGLLRLFGLEDLAYPLVLAVNFLLSLAVIFLLGLVGANILGQQLLGSFEGLLLRLPLVKTIYSSAKQMIETFQGPGRSFQRVVLLQYPRQGLWSIGLVATERADNLNLVPGNRVLSVFVPTTPNPTSGYLVIVSPEDVVDLDFSVEDAFKFIVSGGGVSERILRSGGLGRLPVWIILPYGTRSAARSHNRHRGFWPGAGGFWYGKTSFWKFCDVELRRAPAALPGPEFDLVQAAALGNVARSPVDAVRAYRAVADVGVHGGGLIGAAAN